MSPSASSAAAAATSSFGQRSSHGSITRLERRVLFREVQGQTGPPDLSLTLANPSEKRRRVSIGPVDVILARFFFD